jgi:predicted CXXCH cytochrome family protein
MDKGDGFDDERMGPGRLQTRSVVVMGLLLMVMMTAAIMATSLEDGEVRSVADGDNSYMEDALYIGSGECADCHEDQGDRWHATPHAGAFGPATGETVVGDWSAEPSFEVAPTVTVTPELIENETGFYMDLDGKGSHVYRVDYVQGAGLWLQVYLTEQGNSRYLLPYAWGSSIQQWVPFQIEEWFTDAGEPMMAGKEHVWDLKCVACHTVNARVEHNSTSGEWTATWEEEGVACEACHGPGSLHKKPPSGEERTDYIWRTEDSDVCGNCHAGQTPVGSVGGAKTGYPLSAEGRTIRPGDPHDLFFTHTPELHPDGETAVGQSHEFSDYMVSRHARSLATLLDNEDKQDFCLDCHSTDYRLAAEDERPTLETALHDIECALCHDIHGTPEENNLRLDKWETCVQCHRNGDIGPGEDPLPSQKEVLMGEIPIDGLSGDSWMDGEVLCTDCHMPPMAIRVVPYDIPSHTWSFISPAKSIDLGMPNSCTVACHDGVGPGPEQTDAEALDYIETKSAIIEGLITEAEQKVAEASDALDEAMGLGFTTTTIEAANATYINAEFALAFIKRDASMIHNPSFQMDVLNYTIDKGNETVTALMPGRVQGFVKDGDGKAVAGAEVRMDDQVWGSTSGDGSFDFPIAPGDHTFDIYKGGKKERSLTVTVTAGDTTDAGTVKFKKEDSGGGLTGLVTIAMLVVFAYLAIARRRDG